MTSLPISAAKRRVFNSGGLTVAGFRLLLALSVFVFIAGCQSAPVKPELTPLEIQAIQSRDYEESERIVFPSVMSVFQDLGYTIKTADRDTGFITAEGATEAGSRWMLFEGLSKTAARSLATAFIERVKGFTRVRINLVIKNTESSYYGQTTEEDTPVLDAKIYQNAFERIENAIFVRSGS